MAVLDHPDLCPSGPPVPRACRRLPIAILVAAGKPTTEDLHFGIFEAGLAGSAPVAASDT